MSEERSIARFLERAREMATINEDVARSCVYAVIDDAEGVIEGPSARLAEILVSAWGRCEIETRPVKQERETIAVQGVFHDLETGVRITAEVHRRISGTGADAAAMTVNATASIAMRTVAMQGIPRALWMPVYHAARALVIGDASTLPSRRSEALAALKGLGVSAERVLARLRVPVEEGITGGHFVALIGLLNAIRDEGRDASEIFGLPQAEEPKRRGRAGAGVAGLRSKLAQAEGK